MRKSVALHNLGCKVNAYELDVIAQMLAERGFSVVSFEEKADIYIVNTCSVTNIADRKSRQMLHQAKKRNPDAVVVAVGCYVQTGKEKVLADESVDLVIGNNRKKDTAKLLSDYLESRERGKRSSGPEAAGPGRDTGRRDGTLERAEEKGRPETGDKTLGGRSVVDIGRETAYEEMQLTHTAEHTRAYIKIQDGCNQFCSYCIIPYARGRVRSRREEDILREVRGLLANGFREIVLTGIHISSYGMDFAGLKNPGADGGLPCESPLHPDPAGKQEERGRNPFPQEPLLHLLRELDGMEDLARIRLGSLEPRIITPEFVEGLKGVTKLCRHFHLSLQSGCDETLVRMNRRYTTGEYLKKVEMLREAFGHAAITTDVIVGFPGETDEEFARTMRFLKTVNFYEMHVFQYSRREGTAAAKRKDQVPEETKKRRSEALLTLAEKQSEDFRKSYIGECAEVLFEETKELCGVSCQVGYTGEYIRAAKKTDESLSGKLCAGKLTGFVRDDSAPDRGLSGGKASDNLLWFE